MPPPSPKSDPPAGQDVSPGRRLLLPWRSLTWQLILVTFLLLTVLVLAVAFGSLAVHQRAMRSLIAERDERAVKAAATALEDMVNHRIFTIRSLALQAGLSGQQQAASILASSSYLQEEFDSGLALFTPDGRLAAALGDQSTWEQLSVTISPSLKTMSTPGSPPTSLSGVSHPGRGEPLILVLAASPGREWVAAGAYSAAGAVQHALVDTLAGGSDSSVIVLDTAQQILYHAGSPFTHGPDLSQHPGITQALRGESGSEYLTIGQEEHVLAYHPIPLLGWVLILDEHGEMVDTPALRTSQMAPLVLAPMLLLAVVALWYGARQIIRPLQTLESRAALLASGNFVAIEEPVGGIDEIQRLQKELVNMAHEVQAAQHSLHGYIGAITAAQEEERQRMARELHDDTIQALIALKQRVQLAQLASRDEKEQALLRDLASLAGQTIENLRRLIRALRPIYLEDLGLVTALEMLARETGGPDGLSVEFKRQGDEKRLDPAVELALYRMAQESLSNVVRHARASRAELSIQFSPQAVRLQVIDNGKGFTVPKSPAGFPSAGHYGLLGMVERAELIGAALKIISRPGQGTRIEIDLPLKPPPRQGG
jgi:signal transduction histidine kinase